MSSKSAMKVTVMPAGHGDCTLVQCGDFNIMVDSGPKRATIHERVRSALANALGEKPINLAIVTHHDDDHIGGLERMLKDETLSVNALLFNSPSHIQDYIQHCNGEEQKVSVRQGIKVAGKLTPCNTKAVVAGDAFIFDKSVRLKFLSPLGADIPRFGASMLAASGTEELAGNRRRNTPVCGQVDELLHMFDDGKAADTSATNGLSLAFCLTFEGRSVLFLGDSWPSRVTPALAQLRAGESRIPFDLVFVSHHGSRNNNTVELYQHIQTASYVISTDGVQNPDVETFARILRAAAPSTPPKFYISESSAELETMFSKSDIDVFLAKKSPWIFYL